VIIWNNFRDEILENYVKKISIFSFPTLSSPLARRSLVIYSTEQIAIETYTTRDSENSRTQQLSLTVVQPEAWEAAAAERPCRVVLCQTPLFEWLIVLCQELPLGPNFHPCVHKPISSVVPLIVNSVMMGSLEIFEILFNIRK